MEAMSQPSSALLMNSWSLEMTMNDPLVREVREVREKHAARFGYDLKAIFRDIKAQQEASGRTYVTYPPPPSVSTAATPTG